MGIVEPIVKKRASLSGGDEAARKIHWGSSLESEITNVQSLRESINCDPRSPHPFREIRRWRELAGPVHRELVLLYMVSSGDEHVEGAGGGAGPRGQPVLYRYGLPASGGGAMIPGATLHAQPDDVAGADAAAGPGGEVSL